MNKRGTPMERQKVPLKEESLVPMMVPTSAAAMVRYWESLKETQKVLPMARLSDQGSAIVMESTTDHMKDSRRAASMVHSWALSWERVTVNWRGTLMER